MKKIIALGGSNSKKSINKAFATYAANLLENVAIRVVDLNDFELPLYGVDLEAEIGIHENALKLDKVLESADGIVLSLAEYNGSYTSAFKNTFDWLSRIDQKVWKNKPMLLMATSPGGRGGANVLKHSKELMPFFGGNVIADFSLPSFYDNFKENALQNEELKTVLNEKIKLFQEAI